MPSISASGGYISAILPIWHTRGPLPHQDLLRLHFSPTHGKANKMAACCVGGVGSRSRGQAICGYHISEMLSAGVTRQTRLATTDAFRIQWYDGWK